MGLVKEIPVSSPCDQSVHVTHCLGRSDLISFVGNICFGAPQLMHSPTDTLLQRICSLCQLHFIKCAKSVLVSFLATAMSRGTIGQNGRPATVCRRLASGTGVTPTPINDIACDGLTRPNELADLRMSIQQLHERQLSSCASFAFNSSSFSPTTRTYSSSCL